MVEGPYPVRWTGGQAVVTLPEHLDVSNAGQIGEELVSAANRGATVVIADMTATVSCDHAGADAVARAHQGAASSSTQLRLAVPAQAVRRVLSINGLEGLASIYPSLAAAVVAGVPAAGAAAAAGQADGGLELLARIANRLSGAGLNLQVAIGMSHDVDSKRIADAIECLDDIIREIHGFAFAARQAASPPAPPTGDR